MAVFLGWAPHPVNDKVEMKYLDGGDEIFGPNYGGANVYTNVRKNYLNECKNIGQLLKNLEFNLEIENELMEAILNQDQTPSRAAIKWMKQHPDSVNQWLKNVTTRDGKDSKTALQAYLNSNV